MSESSEKPEQSGDEYPAEVEKKQDRKLSARKKKDRSVWFGLGMFGLVGWSVAIPTVIGAFIGLWIDSTYAGKTSWTLTLLFVGIVLGCWNAWRWVKREGEKTE
jgi:ATP synthase protein I